MKESKNKGAYIVTGATGSIGREIAMQLAKDGHNVILACRDTKKAESLKREIVKVTANRKILYYQLSLESLQSIQNFVKSLLKDGINIYALINNAGTMCRKFQVTSDGEEMTFAVNLTGTLMLTTLTMPLITSGGHIIFTTSLTRKLHKPSTINLNESESEFSQLATYGRSKAALTYFSMEMARCYPDFHINCVDPGIVDSNMITMHRWYDPLANILFRPLISSPRKAAKATMRALKLTTSGNIVTTKNIIPTQYDTNHDPDICHLITSIRTKISTM